MKTFAKYFPAGIVALAALMLIGRAMPPSPKSGKMDLYAFGQIPVQNGGRVQPLDTYARVSLTIISGKQEVDETLPDKTVVTHPAIEWLLDQWAKPEKAEQYRIFRIEHPQILRLLEQPDRPGSYRYSPVELDPRRNRLVRASEEAADKEKEKRTLYDEKIMELSRHYDVYQRLKFRVSPGMIPADDPNGKWLSYGDVVQKFLPELMPVAKSKARLKLLDDLKKNPDSMIDLVRKHIGDDVKDLKKAEEEFGGKEQVWQFVIEQEVNVLAVPVVRDEIAKALPDAYPPAAAMEKILAAYKADDAAAFNTAVTEYKENHTTNITEEDKSKARLEARMNFFDPFLQCAALYVGVMILAALSWLVWHTPLRQAAFGLACLTLLVHTAALLGRMYIGNRPPVTNLYSSAVFIGWGGLVLCLILERFYKLGVGTFAGGILGFSTMLIARFLAESGDTLEMLQAVLDTNFWLATHVTCVTMGYVATFVAGLIGVIYILGGVFTTGMKADVGKKVAGMMYGTICFAMLLSFTGTVLGGIWADQSWGRFWGWDPKENGAVLIVIWNALILHARWGGLVKPRGMAVLAVVGNMWTAWSWFGTNQLGIGLHAYGFDNRLATGCALFWVSQGLIAALGMVPTKYWASFAPTTK